MGEKTRFLAVLLLLCGMAPVSAAAAAAEMPRDAKLYYESGALKGEFPYLNGQLEGTVKWYYESGALGALMNYRKNRLQGFSWTFYETGSPRRIVHLENNKPVGPAKFFSEDGHLIEVQNHIEGKPANRWKYGPDGCVDVCEEIGPEPSAADAAHGV
jgi:antitoxin component YwqK of YwqJK toxin-antitoxin module